MTRLFPLKDAQPIPMMRRGSSGDAGNGEKTRHIDARELIAVRCRPDDDGALMGRNSSECRHRPGRSPSQVEVTLGDHTPRKNPDSCRFHPFAEDSRTPCAFVTTGGNYPLAG